MEPRAPFLPRPPSPRVSRTELCGCPPCELTWETDLSCLLYSFKKRRSPLWTLTCPSWPGQVRAQWRWGQILHLILAKRPTSDWSQACHLNCTPQTVPPARLHHPQATAGKQKKWQSCGVVGVSPENWDPARPDLQWRHSLRPAVGVSPRLLAPCGCCSRPPASPSLNTLCRSLDALPDNHKFKQLQRELSQVLTQRQVYIQPDN